MAKRASLKDRRATDQQGLNAIFQNPTEAISEPENKVSDNKENFIKATYYLELDQITVLETIQLKQRKETGSKPDKSSLVREAISLLAEKYS